MPFLVKADFKTHIYIEIIDTISRTDDTILDKAISSAIGEAKSYLSRYDLTAIFGVVGGAEPTVSAAITEHLKNVVKDIASWHMIKLANPNVDLKLFRTNYEDAIAWLTKVQKGQADPDGWPYKPDDPATAGNENTGIQWSSNRKRTQHF
jgi:phage gp36-like protein